MYRVEIYTLPVEKIPAVKGSMRCGGVAVVGVV